MSVDYQVFLSYRRSDSGGHARALERDLYRRFAREQIFFDRSSIDSGNRFPDHLHAAVAQCRVLVALIGPEWLDVKDVNGRRRLEHPGDFVRQEIALALELGRAVVPVLFDDEPVPSADRLPEPLKPLSQCDSLTLRGKTYEYDRQLEELVRLLRKHAPDLRLRKPDLVKGYDRLFGEHELFSGRESQLAEMNAFVSGRANGHLFITGRSGSGKTALMVNWVRTLQDREDVDLAYHFLNRKLDTASEADMLRSLVQQLVVIRDCSETVPVPLDELRVSYAGLLEEEAPKRPLIVVIDGLDEADPSVPWPRHFPGDLPQDVFLCFSARDIADVDWLNRLQLGNLPVETISLGGLSHNGVRDLLLSAGGRPAVLAADNAAVAEIADRSEGDPLFLRFLVDDIAGGAYNTALDLQRIPKGLEEYLGEWWKSIGRSAARETSARELLGYLVAARGRLTRDELIDIDPGDTLDGFTVDDAIEQMQRFVLGHRDDGYALCHPRFQDYVARNVVRNDTIYRDRILAYCARWGAHKSHYAIAAYPRHLIEQAKYGAPAERQEAFGRLAALLTDLDYQQTYMDKTGDSGTFQQYMQEGLSTVPPIDDDCTFEGLIRLGLESDAFRRRGLRPESIFEAARRRDLQRAEADLRLFGADLDWRQLSYPVIAWLAGKQDAEAGKRFLSDHATELDPQQLRYPLLLERVSADLEGRPEPPLDIPYAGPLADVGDLGLARALVARIGGQIGENPSAFDYEALMAHAQGSWTFAEMDMGVETPTYVVENDSPILVAAAAQHPHEGLELLQRYIAIHGANPYGVYRNRSLFGIAGAVMCHPDLESAMGLLQLLIIIALQPGGADYTEPLLIAATAVAAAGDDSARTRLDEMRNEAQAAASNLFPERNSSDSWGHHCRRLAALAEAYDVVLGDPTTAKHLLSRAQQLPFGYAGFQAPASLAVAEALHICGMPGEAQGALDRSFRSAHKVQEPPFCATTTARINAVVHHWWTQPIWDLAESIERLHEDLELSDFTAVHIVGEPYQWRGDNDPTMLPIPHEMREARSLPEIARNVYRLPTAELVRVNPGIDPAVQLQDGSHVRVPDPTFAPILAARLAAEVVLERHALGALAPVLLGKLVSVAAGNPTALNLVLARLLLVLGPARTTAIAAARELAPTDWMTDPASGISS